MEGVGTEAYLHNVWVLLQPSQCMGHRLQRWYTASCRLCSDDILALSPSAQLNLGRDEQVLTLNDTIQWVLGNTQTCLTKCSRGFWVKILLACAQVPSRTISAAPSPATPSGSCGILVCSTATEQSECVHHQLWSTMTSLQPLFSASPLLLHLHSQYYIMKVEKHFAAFHFLVLHFAGRLSEGSQVYLWLTFEETMRDCQSLWPMKPQVDQVNPKFTPFL